MKNASRSSRVTAADLPEDVIIEFITQLNRVDKRRSTMFSDNCMVLRAGLITCTHVFRGWRSAALNCAKLWADIDCASWGIEQIKTFLCRSKDASIELSMVLPLCYKKMPPYYRADPGFEGRKSHMQEYNEYEDWLYDDEVPPKITLCLEEFHRTRSISIVVLAHGFQRWISNLINSLCTVDAPLLEYFSLNVRLCSCFGHFNLEGHLFKNDTPLLRTVRLYGVHISGDHYLLRNLTSLSMRFVKISGGYSVFQVLERSPLLNKIVLEEVKYRSVNVHDGDNYLSLPLLATATLCGPPGFCASLMGGLRIPTKTRLSILYTHTQFTEAFAEEAIPPFEINEHIRAFVCVDVQQMSMEIQSLNISSVRADEDSPSFSLSKGRRIYYEKVNYFWGLNQLSSKLGRADATIKRLDIYIRCLLQRHGATPWKTLFSRLHGLEIFVIHFDTCSTKAMMENGFTHTLGKPSDMGELYLPKLRNLVLVIRRPLTERIARLLGRCLESRTKYDPSWRLESLRIECYVNSQQLQEFEDCPWVMFDLQGYLEPHVGRFEISWSDSLALKDFDESSLNIQLFKTGYSRVENGIGGR